MHLNIYSLKNKVDRLQVFLEKRETRYCVYYWTSFEGPGEENYKLGKLLWGKHLLQKSQD